jgi:hypothetical protein
MSLARRSSERGHAGKFWRTSYLFEGFIRSLPEPTYELSGSLDQQPIATHPDFEDFAGTPSAPLNGAVFVDPETGRVTDDDAIGVFREFGSAGGEFGGLESYLDPGATWTKISFAATRPTTLRALGTKMTPDGSPPSLTGRDWLFWETSFRVRGYIVEVRETWKLSGRGGWLSIYD